MPPATPLRRRSTLFIILLLWAFSYASFTLFAPPLLDDAYSVHAEGSRVLLLRHDNIMLCGATTAHALAVAARILRRSPCWPSRSSSKHSPVPIPTWG